MPTRMPGDGTDHGGSHFNCMAGRLYTPELRGAAVAAAADPRLILPLAEATPATMRMSWPDGSVEDFFDLLAGRYVALRRGGGRPAARPIGSSAGSGR